MERRPELDKLLDRLRPGDTLMMWWLNRSGRSIRHLIDQLQVLADRGVGFRSSQGTIDITSLGGLLVLAASVEFERDLIRERTAAGLQAARLAVGSVAGPLSSPATSQGSPADVRAADMTVAQIG